MKRTSCYHWNRKGILGCDKKLDCMVPCRLYYNRRAANRALKIVNVLIGRARRYIEMLDSRGIKKVI